VDSIAACGGLFFEKEKPREKKQKSLCEKAQKFQEMTATSC